jgi:hypothetical protein
MEESLVRAPRVETEAEIVQSSGVKEEVGQVTETTGDSSGPPPSLLVEAKQPPEICNLLEMGEAFNHFHMHEYTVEIDSFINERVKSAGLPDDKSSYKKVFEEILTKSNAPRDDLYSMVERIKEYVSLQTRLIQIAKDKEEFDKKPIEEMTSKELKKVLYDASNKR